MNLTMNNYPPMNTKLTTIKKAETESDKNQCRILINRVFRASQLVSRQDCDMISAEELHQELSGEGKEVYMLCQKNTGALIGTVLLILYKTLDAADVCYLAISPDQRGFGLGTVLMQHIEQRAKTLGKKVIRLSVVYHPQHTQAKLEQWYIQQGYRYTESQFANEQEKLRWFAPEYRDEICFKVLEKRL